MNRAIVVVVFTGLLIFFTYGVGYTEGRSFTYSINIENIIFSLKSCEYNNGLQEIFISKELTAVALCENGAIFKLPDQKNLKTGTEKEA